MSDLASFAITFFSVMFCVERMVADAMDCSRGYCPGEGIRKGAGKRAMGVPQDVHISTHDMPENAKTAEHKGEATFMKLLTPLFYTSLYCPGLYSSVV